MAGEKKDYEYRGRFWSNRVRFFVFGAYPLGMFKSENGGCDYKYREFQRKYSVLCKEFWKSYREYNEGLKYSNYNDKRKIKKKMIKYGFYNLTFKIGLYSALRFLFPFDVSDNFSSRFNKSEGAGKSKFLDEYKSEFIYNEIVIEEIISDLRRKTLKQKYKFDQTLKFVMEKFDSKFQENGEKYSNAENYKFKKSFILNPLIILEYDSKKYPLLQLTDLLIGVLTFPFDRKPLKGKELTSAEILSWNEEVRKIRDSAIDVTNSGEPKTDYLFDTPNINSRYWKRFKMAFFDGTEFRSKPPDTFNRMEPWLSEKNKENWGKKIDDYLEIY